ncbi:MAG: hypothetical protein JST04_15685 [Bdellovibrionales bacterium]|nr:hypothetical protein [Bdellovibrionales bacterium]
MRFPREFVALSVIAATALSLGHARNSGRYEMREPIPSSVFIPREGKRLACFITINSSDEKGVFTQYLNPAEWDLVELTEPAANGAKSGWFDAACKKNYKCDIDVVSGHFAGRFFGSSGYTLGLNELENHSCAQDCKGIMENPREVYLFGCNALATKEKDHRTPAEYYQVLVDDGYSPDTARRVVEDRYGAFGQDNRGKVQRAFSGVPYIYGFFSTSPLGKDLKPILENYMRKLGDFTKHFDSIVDRGTSAKTETNAALGSAMKGQSFTQCSGLDPKDPEYAFHIQICALFDKSIPLADRLLSVEVMLNSEKVLMLLPSIQNFMRANIREIKTTQSAIFARLQSNANARKILLETIADVKTAVTKIEWMRFAHLMGWITREDLVRTIYQLVDSAFAAPYFETELGDTICSLNVAGVNQIDFSAVVAKIQPFHFNVASAVQAMRCTGLARYPEFRARAADAYKDRSISSGQTTDLLASLFVDGPAILEPTDADRALLARLRSQCEKFPLNPLSPVCGRAMANLGATDEATAASLAAMVRAATPSLQMSYADSLHSMRAGLDLLETAFVDVYLTPNHPFWYGIERYFAIEPIRGDENQKRILNYLLTRADGRRPDEMIYALRETKLSPEAVANLFTTTRSKPNVLITSRVFDGFLSLAQNAGSDPAFIEMLFKQHASVTVSNDVDLAGFYAALELPRVKAVLKSSKTAQDAVCAIMKSAADNLGFDDYGDAVARKIPVKTCAELIAE